MKIILKKDSWYGELLQCYPTNICSLAWAIGWRVALATLAAVCVVAYIWLWCAAFEDAFIGDNPSAAGALAAWLVLSLLAGVGVAAASDFWLPHVKRWTSRCPQVEWEKE